MKTNEDFEETPIEKINDYTEALEYFHEYSPLPNYDVFDEERYFEPYKKPRDKDIKDIKYETGELLDLIVEVCHQEPDADGIPTDEDCLKAINDALYYHYLV